MSGEHQSGPAQTDRDDAVPSATRAVVTRARDHAILLAVVGFLAAGWQADLPFETAKSLVAVVGLELKRVDMLWLIPALGAALGVVTGSFHGWLGYKKKIARLATMQELAISIGAQFSARPDRHLRKRLHKFFRNAHRINVTNLFRIQSEGMRVAVADVECTTIFKRGQHRQGTSMPKTHQTLAFLDSGDFPIPEFTLQPEGFLLSAMADLAGIQDVNFPAHPEFSKAYYLSSRQPEGTRRLFGERLISALELKIGLCIQSSGGSLILYRRGRVAGPTELKGFVTEAMEILRLIRISAQFAAANADLAPARQ